MQRKKTGVHEESPPRIVTMRLIQNYRAGQGILMASMTSIPGHVMTKRRTQLTGKIAQHGPRVFDGSYFPAPWKRLSTPQSITSTMIPGPFATGTEIEHLWSSSVASLGRVGYDTDSYTESTQQAWRCAVVHLPRLRCGFDIAGDSVSISAHVGVK